jgi:cadmium resistance protein CadD (predicted permease)
MGALASVAARWLVRHPRLSPSLHAIERHLVPWLLVGIGLYILSDTPTDTV